MWFYHTVMHSKTCRRNCKQCRPWSDCSCRSSLTYVYTDCQDMSIQKLRIITVTYSERSMFSEQAQDRAAPGSAIHPQHQGICLGIAGWLYKPDNYTCSVKAKAWKGQDASLRIWQVKKVAIRALEAYTSLLKWHNKTGSRHSADIFPGPLGSMSSFWVGLNVP